MSNEEQAVLNFFAQDENISLALTLAEQLDASRQQMNNDYWLKLNERIAAQISDWQVTTTADRDTENCLVGLHLHPPGEHKLFLQPMMEQQIMGGIPRIYFGLMWIGSPAPDITQRANIKMLRDTLQEEGYKNNERFLAWQWTRYHPRRKDFLLRFSTKPDTLLEESAALLLRLLEKHNTVLQAINTELQTAPQSAAVLLDQLRVNLKH